MKQKLAFIALLTAAVGIASCTDTPVNDDPDAFRLKGTLSGWAEIVDYKTTNTYEPSGGLTISVDGTEYKTTSDSTGHWAIKDLPAGTYTVSCSKEGFGTAKEYNVQFVGGGDLVLINSLRIARTPSEFSVTNFRYDGVKGAGEGASLALSGTLPQSLPEGLRMLIVIAKDTTMDVTVSRGSSPLYITADMSMGSGGLYLKNIYEAGFKSGDQVYSFAHIFNNRDGASEFFDPFRRVTMRIAMSPVRSNVVRFTLP